jgi:hypothetical protein
MTIGHNEQCGVCHAPSGHLFNCPVVVRALPAKAREERHERRLMEMYESARLTLDADLESERRLRRLRHHDVLCLVLKDSIAHTSEAQDANRAPDFVRLARLYADLAYPPPKAEEP